MVFCVGAMRAAWRRWAVLLGGLGCITLLHGQSLRVAVELQGEGAAEGASVQLLDETGSNLIDFAFAEADGQCAVKAEKAGGYLVRIRYFGYRDTLLRVALQPRAEANVHVRLAPIAYDLPNISIVDKIIGLRRRGDTLSYNLRAYASGAEQTFGDVLATLPGLTVDEDGQVRVGTEKADALLLDGKDLLKGQHHLATQGLQAQALEAVELIFNYRDAEAQFEGRDGEGQVAVNLITAGQGSGKWQGNAQVLGGYRRAVRTEASGFRSGASSGWAVFMRQQTTGEGPRERPIGQRLQALLREHEFGEGLVRKLNPWAAAGEMGLEPGTVRNHDWHLSLHGDSELSPALHQTLYFSAAGASRSVRQQMLNSYIGTGIEELLEKESRPLLAFFDLDYRLRWEKGRHAAGLHLPVGYYRRAQQEAQHGTLGGSQFEQSLYRRQPRYTFRPEVSHTVKWGRAWLLKAAAHWWLQGEEQNLEIRSSLPFLGFEQGAAAPSYFFQQLHRFESARAGGQAELTKSWGRSYISYILEASRDWEQARNQSSGFFEPIDARMATQVWQQRFKAVKDWGKKVRLMGGLAQASVAQAMGRQATARRFWLPSVLCYVEYFKGHAFSVSGRRAIEYAGLWYQSGSALVERPQWVQVQSLAPPGIQQRTEGTFSLLKRPTSGGALYNLSLSITAVSAPFVQGNSLEGQTVYGRWLFAPESQQFSMSAFFLHSLPRWKLQGTAYYLRERGFASLGGTLEPLQRAARNIQFSLASVRLKEWQVKAEARHTGGWQKVEGRHFSFDQFWLEAEAARSMGDWHVRLGYRQGWQRGGGASSRVGLLDVAVAYSLDAPWKLFFRGHNLLNLCPAIQTEAFSQPHVEQARIFEVFPGQVMAGAGYYF